MRPNYWIPATFFFACLTFLFSGTRTTESQTVVVDIWNDHYGLIISLVAFVLAYLLAIIGATYAIEMQRRSKIADFRQEWINDIRSDVSELIEVASHDKKTTELAGKGNRIAARIRMRLKSDGTEEKEITRAINALIANEGRGTYQR